MNGIADAAVSNTFTDQLNGNNTPIVTRFAEAGLPGAIITVYGDNETVLGTTTSTSTGSWTVAIPVSYTGINVLVECKPPGSLSFLQPGPQGADNQTTVAVVARTATGVNFTFGLGSEHAQDNPDLALACFALPNPSNATGNPGTSEPMVIRFPYINGGPLTNSTRAAVSGTGQNYYSTTRYPPITSKKVLTTFGQTGTVYGVAYDKRRNRLLTSAFERAYTGIGPNGTGGEGKLYVTTFASNGDAAATSLWLDLETALSNGVAGTDPVSTTGLTFVSSTPTTISRFEHNKIGHISLGDLEFSADGKTVFVVNLFSKQIYGIPVNTDGTPNTTAIKTYTPTNPCASGTFADPAIPAGARPYNALLGLGIHPETGRVYCAVTCTGPAAADLKGYIYSFDPTAAIPTYTQEVQIPLAISFQTGSDGTEGTYATTTNDVWAPVVNNSDVTNAYSDHAWMGDIVFDIEPNGTTYMVVGGRNRFMDATSGSRITHGQGLWLAAPNGSAWTLESNGVAGSRTTSNVLSLAWFAARSGNGVFFNAHGSEGTNGTGNIIAIPGFTELALGAVDNIKSAGNSGLMFMKRSDGSRTRDILLLGSLTAGGTAPRGEVYKANLWGEVEALLEPAPLEVGNYVFNDLNKNGLQDPSDLPIAGVTVSLVEDTNGDGLPNETVVASTTTNASGHYYFDRADGLKFDTKYVIVLNKATDFATGALSGLMATAANSASDTKNSRDSDGELLGTSQYVKVAFETGGPGENQHIYDFGFIAIPCSVDVAALPGDCLPATNKYTLTGTISLTNTPASSLTISDGTATTALSVSAGQASVAYSLTGLNSGTGVHTVTVLSSATACSAASTTYAAPLSCTVAPCGVVMTITPGLCQSATNGYVLSGSITASSVPASGTLTISAGSFSPRSLTLPAGNSFGTFSYSGLVSTGQVYTVTASYSNSACSPVSQTYTAPVSCSVAPVCSLTATATPGLCATATNTYSSTVVVRLTNLTAGILTITDGAKSVTFVTTAATSNTFTAVYDGFVSNGSTHTIVASLPGCSTATTTYTAPASCSIAPVCSVSAIATPGLCAGATNTYSVTAVATVQNPVAGAILTISTGGGSVTFVTVAGSLNSFVTTFTNLISDGASHAVTISLPGCSTTTTTYTAPVSCSVAPVCSLTATATPGLCATATNTYSSTAVVRLTNPTAGTLTITDGPRSVTFVVTASTSATFTAVFVDLVSDGSAHTVTASLPGCSTTTATYTAPASCSVAPSCSLSTTVTAGLCATATNTYSSTAVVTVLNPAQGVSLSITNGAQTLTFSTTAASQNTFRAVFNGLISDGDSHTVVTSLPGCGTTSSVYTAPASCSVAPVCSISAVATPGLCATATNTFSTTVVVTLTNPTAGTLTVTDGVSSITFAVPASLGTTTAVATFNGILSDGSRHTVRLSLPGCATATTTYTSPGSCSVSPKASLGDFVWYDTNENGQQDTGEAGVPGITVRLFAPASSTATPIASLTTDSNGMYLFPELEPGVYYVIFDKTTVPPGYTLTTANKGSDATDSDADAITGKTTTYTLAAGDQNLTVDAGLVQPLGSLGDFVWKDNNDNGIQDVNEPGVAGVQVELFTVTGGVRSSSAASTTVTDASGHYSFSRLPLGDYQVRFSQIPTSCTLTPNQNSGIDDALDSDVDPKTGFSQVVHLDPASPGLLTNNPTLDAGLQRTVYDPTGYIYCYKDNTILKGGTISVTGPGSVTIILDGSRGYYRFVTNGTPGSYTLAYSHPNGYSVAGTSRPASAAAVDPTSLDGSSMDKDIPANGWVQLGSLPSADTTQLQNGTQAFNPYYLVFNVQPGDPYISSNNLPIDCTLPLGSIGDFVWEDTNKNGQQDTGEPGVNGVTVRLLQETTPGNYTVVNTTVTAGGGKYLFPNLPAGTYVVEFDKTTLPANYTLTTATATGVPDESDSNADLITGRSGVITLVPINPAQRDILTIDAGIVNTACPPAKCIPILISRTR